MTYPKNRETRVAAVFAGLRQELRQYSTTLNVGHSSHEIAYAAGKILKTVTELDGSEAAAEALQALADSVSAAEVAVSEENERRAKQYQDHLWAALTEFAGIQRGETIYLPGIGGGHKVLVKTESARLDTREYSPEPIALTIAGYQLHRDGTPKELEYLQYFKILDLAQIVDLLPRDRAEAVRARWPEKPVRSLREEIQHALDTEHPFFYATIWERVAHELLNLADTDDQEIRERLGLQRASDAKIDVTLSLEITSRDNLAIEWFTDNREAWVSVQTSTLLGYYRPNRLVQLSNARVLFGILEPLGRARLDPQKTKQWEEGWDLLVRFAFKTMNEYLEKIGRHCNVVRQTARVVLLESAVTGGLPSLALVEPVQLTNPSEANAVERLTGFTADTLLHRIPAFDWRNPEGDGAHAWCEMIVNIGGRDPRETVVPGWAGLLTAFYKRHDPKEQAAQQKAAVEAEQFKAEQRLTAARELLKSLPIGHKTGWNKTFAEKMGVHTTDVKRWIVKNLPDMAATMYPPKAEKA